MKENSVTDTQMDAHLARVQREAKSTLDRFGESGIKVTKPFVDYFLEVTYERLEQTCRRYNPEARWKIPIITPEPTKKCDQKVSSDADQSKNVTTSNLVDVQHPKSSDKKQGTKRQSNSPVISEQSKKANITIKDGTEKYTTYLCVHCFDQKNFAATNSCNGTINDVYDHWLAKHSNEAISKPFQFYAVASVVCFYCEDIGTYHYLVEHHKAKHSGQQFAIVNRRNQKKCGICHFNDGDLIEHFKEKHNPNDVQVKMIFNPIRYSETRIADLMKINVHKKRQCKVCNEVFETHDEIVKHFANLHNGQTVQSKEFIDKRNTPTYLMCGYCHKKIDCTKLVNHFGEHSYSFPCSKCLIRFGDMSELIYHENIVHNIHLSQLISFHSKEFPGWMKPKFFSTDMVFGNGLTLKMYNVLETKFDNYKLFEMFIEGFLDLMKDQAKKKIELNTSQTQNRPTSQTSTIPTSSNISTVTPSSQTRPETRSTFNWATPIIKPNDQHHAAVTITTSRPQLYSPQIQLPSQTGSTVPIRRPNDITELLKQQKLAKNVYIGGISSDLDIRNLYDIFLLFCQKLCIFITHEDIEGIVQLPDGIIVKFHQLQTKETFMSQTIGVKVRSTDLFRLPAGQATRMINVQHHMTPYYNNIFMEARRLERKYLLHSYKLGKNGFLIKITANGAEHTIQSKQQLMSLIRS